MLLLPKHLQRHVVHIVGYIDICMTMYFYNVAYVSANKRLVQCKLHETSCAVFCKRRMPHWIMCRLPPLYIFSTTERSGSKKNKPEHHALALKLLRKWQKNCFSYKL